MPAPSEFAILTNRDAVVFYFEAISEHLTNRERVILDLSNITSTDLPAICLLIAFMMDSRSSAKNLQYLTVQPPSKDSPAAELFEKAKFRETVTRNGVADHGFFLSRADKTLNKRYTLDILNYTNRFFGEKVDLSTLAPILTELFTNTNNHASPGVENEEDARKVPWFVSVLEVPEEQKVCYCVMDIGIGIYDSLKRRGLEVSKKSSRMKRMYDQFFGRGQSELLAENIPKGVQSSTELIYRGQGLRDVHNKAMEGPYKRFEVLTNKARVDLLNIRGNNDDSKYNFKGTIYYWEICGE
jgi:hypothetical protein